jgi:hypothetical protein
MITCERCQTENLEGSQYCDECGAILPGAAQGGRRASNGDGEEGNERADVVQAAAESSEPPVESEPRAAAPKREPAEANVSTRSQVITPARTSIFGPGEQVDSLAPRRTGSTVAHAKLVIHRGRSVGKEFPLCEDESHIGRWDADGGIFPDVDLDSDDPEAKVSRRHARITHRGEKYYIEDLGSTNGTFVNRGRRLLPGDRQPLRDGDEVIVGKTFLKFHVLKSSS